MANLQYIGARYVPKFYLNPDYPAPDTRNNDWKAGVDYESLMIVTYNNDSYTSKKPVPDTIGDPANNPDYWACTTKYTAALMALQTTVQNLEDFVNPDVALNTTAQTASEAINEINEKTKYDELREKFESYRYGSIAAGDSQACIYANGHFIIATTSSSNLVLSKYDTDLNPTNVYNYPLPCHPNSMFIMETNLYVVDSTNHDLIVIDLDTMSYLRTITDYESWNIASGCFYDGYVYLYGSNKVYKLDTLFNLTQMINLSYADHAGATVHQGIFIYDDVIYRVINQPNALIMNDMLGNLIGVKEMGDGSGFYPYGEVETFFMMNDKVCFNTKLWSITPKATPFISEIFVSNIGNPVINDSKYGQRTPEREIIYCGTRTSKNPDGTAGNPFDHLYEAASVINYLCREYPFAVYMHLAENIFSTEELTINGCNLTLSPTGRSIKAINAFNSKIQANQITIDSVDFTACEVKLNRCTIGDMRLINCYTFFGGSKITTSYHGENVISPDGKVQCNAPLADVSTTGGFIPTLNSRVNGSYSTPQKLSTLAEKFHFSYLSSAHSKLTMYFTLTGSAFTSVNFVHTFRITTGNKTTYNGGNVVDKAAKDFIQDANGNSGWLSYTLHLDPSTGIYIDSVTFTDINGTTLTPPNDFYNADYSIEFSEDATIN